MGSRSNQHFVIGMELFPAGRKAWSNRFVKPSLEVPVKAGYRLFLMSRSWGRVGFFLLTGNYNQYPHFSFKMVFIQNTQQVVSFLKSTVELFFFATCSDKEFYLRSEKFCWAKNLWWAQHMYNTHAALEEKIFWWENHWLEMFLSALEKIIGHTLFVRWLMAALHKAHSWTPRKKNPPFLFDMCQTQYVSLSLFLRPIQNNFKFTSLFL